MKAQLSQVHWYLVLATSVLVYFLTLLLGIALSLPLPAFLKWSHVDAQRASQAFSLLTAFLVIVVTGCGAWWAARRVERGALLHGFFVGLAVALLSSTLDVAFSQKITLAGLVLYVLMVAAGLLGGVLGSRKL